MRGKDFLSLSKSEPKLGSPPLARERLYFHQRLSIRCGITPACAGKTYMVLKYNHLRWDHPRLRGKDGMLQNNSYPWMGSPPLARERPTRQGPIPPVFRITPACAGKTRLEHLQPPVPGDHPRLRGKDLICW